MELLDFLRTQVHANRLANHRLHDGDARALARGVPGGADQLLPEPGGDAGAHPRRRPLLPRGPARRGRHRAALREAPRGAASPTWPRRRRVADQRFIVHVAALAAAGARRDGRARPRRRPDPARTARQRHRPSAQPPGASPRPGPRDARRHRGGAAAARRVPDAERGAPARSTTCARSAGARRRCSAEPRTTMESIYLTPEHELLREQVARFVAREVEPHALAWEDAGMTPREVLQKARRRRPARPDVRRGARRRRRRRADQPGLRRGAVAVDLRRLHHHRAGPHRHGEPAPAPRRQRRAEGEVDAGDHGRGRRSPPSRSPSRAPDPTSPASARPRSARPTAASGS